MGVGTATSQITFRTVARPASGNLVFEPATILYSASLLCFPVGRLGLGHLVALALKNNLFSRVYTALTWPPPLPLQPSGPSCQACSNRLPHQASSAYVIADTDHRCPPGAPPGALFAVMDPVPCRCVAADGSCRRDGVLGKRKPGSAAEGGGDERAEKTREPYDPPVLWPVKGDKFAYRRGQGPVVHGLRLESAYAQQGDGWGTGEPAFSSYHHMFKVNESVRVST